MAVNRPASLQVIDPVLTNLARAYKPSGFISDMLVPRVPVATLSGQYPVFDSAFWFGSAADNIKNDRAPTREVDFEWSLSPYFAKEYALKVSITDLERQQANTALRLESSKVAFLSLQMALAREKRTAAILKKVSAGTPGALNLGAAPSVNWDQDTATIIADIETAKNAIYDATGTMPNTIVLPYKVAAAVAQQEDIKLLITYEIQGGRGQSLLSDGVTVLPPVIAGLRVMIPQGALTNTANEGATQSLSEIWGDDPRVLYVNSNAQWGEPTVAQRFTHTAPQIKRWRTDDPDVEYIRELERYDERVVAPDVGYEIQNVLS